LHSSAVKNDQMKLMALIEPGMLWQANCQTHQLQSGELAFIAENFYVIIAGGLQGCHPRYVW
jgi:hypothetical protein